MRIRILLSLALLTALVFPSAAIAVCSNNMDGQPGQEGEIEYFSDNVLKYCDGNGWVPMRANENTANGDSSYFSTAMYFDGTDYITRDGLLTGVSDSNQWTGSFWMRSDNATGVVEIFDSDQTGGGGDLSILPEAANGGTSLSDFSISAENDSGVVVFRVWVHDVNFEDGEWHHVLFSIDLSNNARRHVVLDGVLLSEGVGAGQANFTAYNNAGVMDFTPPGAVGWSIGSSTSAGVNIYRGDIADFWMDFGTYIDLSVAANRSKFITSSNTPKYLGAFGEAPTGTAPDIFLSGDPATWHINDGTGGGFTVNGAIESPVESFNNGTSAVSFDGNTRVAFNGLSGLSNSDAFTTSFWVKPSTERADFQVILNANTGTNDRLILALDNGGSNTNGLWTVYFEARNASGNLVAEYESAQILPQNQWSHVMISVDASASIVRSYINGTVDTNYISVNPGNGDINFNVANHSIGEFAFGGDSFDGALADLWFDTGTYIDFSTASNRSKFLYPDGTGRFLGANGQLPTGSAPDIFMSGAPVNWSVNKGSGGGFTTTGNLGNGSNLLPQDVTSDLVAWWKMDQAGGNVPDASGNGRTATASGSWIYNTSGGVKGGYLQKNSPASPSTVLNAGSSSDFDLPNATVSMWIRPNDLYSGGAKYYIGKDEVGETNVGEFAIWLDSGNPNNIHLKTNDGSGPLSTTAPLSGINAGEWIHVVASVGDAGAKLYINGVLRNHNPEITDGMMDTAANLIIGNDRDGAGVPIDVGDDIDDVRIYDRALTDQEIERIYVAGGGEYYNIDNKGYFVLIGNGPSDGEPYEFSGNLGGLNGANATCLSYLQTYDWNGKEDAVSKGLLTDGNVFAWLCNSSTCQNMEPNRAYQFATTQDGFENHGGATFFSDSNGFYPNLADTKNWDTTGYFNRGTYFHTGRSATNTPHTNTCNNWTNGTSGSLSRRGYSIRTNEQRFSDTNTNCNTRDQYVCVVNPPVITASNYNSNMLGHWKLDETALPTAIDSSGQGNNGTAAGNTIFDIAGRKDYAADFDGTGDYIAIADDPIFDLSQAGKYSWSTWINPDDVSGDWQTIFSQTGAANNFFYFYAGSSYDAAIPGGGTPNGITVYWWGGGTGWDYMVTEAENVIASNNWYHLVVTYDGSQAYTSRFKIYINGNDVTGATQHSGTVLFDIPVTDIRIGGNALFSDEEFDGTIDDVRYYGRVLSAAEIKSMYQANSISSLIGHWKLDETTGTVAKDSSGSNNNGTLSGFNFGGGSTTGVIGNGARFDGINDFIDTGITSHFSKYTVSVWAKSDAYNTSNVYKLLDKNYNFNVNFNHHDVGGTPKCEHNATGVGTGWVDAGNYQPLEVDRWYHIACTYDGTTASMYIDGELVTSNNIAPPVTETASLKIGRRADQTTLYFDGVIDDARLYNRALSASEIKKLFGCTKPGEQFYNDADDVMQWCDGLNVVDMGDTNSGGGGGGGTPGGPTSNLVAYWALDEAAGATEAVDSAGPNNGDYWGGLNPTNDAVAGRFGSALDFDGNDDEIEVSAHSSINDIFIGGGTISLWVYPRDTYLGDLIFKTTNSGSVPEGYTLAFNPYSSDGRLLFRQSWGVGRHEWRTADAINLNQWNHIAVVYDSTNHTTTPTIYINNVSVAVQLWGDLGGNAAPASDAGVTLWLGYDVDGLMDDIRYYDRELSPAEIGQIYTGSGGSACSQAGALNYETDRYQFCNGSNWIDVGK